MTGISRDETETVTRLKPGKRDLAWNLMDFLVTFCQRCTDNFCFWALVALVALFEPVLCSQYPTTALLRFQMAVIACSTLLYFIQVIGVATKEWEFVQEMQMSLDSFPVVSMQGMKLLKLFLFLMNEEEYLFEGICIAVGWICIIPYPGIASLRCFRVYRLLWFYEVRVFRKSALHYMNPILGKHFVRRVFNVLKFAVKAITALIDEMLRLGHRTRGGIILIMMLFYTSYVMGIVLWVETNGRNENCDSIGNCIFTLVRLTFFDGNGFDFAYFLTEKHKGLFCIVMFYMMLTSFGILNGLVGIFGNVFAGASDEAFGVDGQTTEGDELLEEEDSDEANRSWGNFEEKPAQEMREMGGSAASLSSVVAGAVSAVMKVATGGGSGGGRGGSSGRARYEHADSREMGDNDAFGSGEDLGDGMNEARRVLRKDSESSDIVVPFTADMSLRYIPTAAPGNARKVVPTADPDSPTKSDVPHGGNCAKTNGAMGSSHRKATYEELQQLLDLRRQNKRSHGASTASLKPTAGVGAATGATGGGDGAVGQAPVRQQSAMNVFGPAGVVRVRSARGGFLRGSFDDHSNTSDHNGGGHNQVQAGVQAELRQLREDMREMMNMQLMLHKQLADLARHDVAGGR